MDVSNLPPLHPALVHFPIALVVVSFLADLFGRVFKNASLHSVGWWTLLGATVTGLIAIPLGYFDMYRDRLAPSTHDYVHLHLKIGWILLVAVAGLAAWRTSYRIKIERPIGIGYLAVGFLVMGLTLFQGWFGGEIVFSHGAGVAAAGQGTETKAQAEKRLATMKDVLERVPGFKGEAEHRHGGETMTEPSGAATNHEEHLHHH